jgi:hypothetical protein
MFGNVYSNSTTSLIYAAPTRNAATHKSQVDATSGAITPTAHSETQEGNKRTTLTIVCPGNKSEEEEGNEQTKNHKRTNNEKNTSLDISKQHQLS